MQTAVTQQSQATRICRNIASDLARPFCTEVEWEDVVSFSEVCVRDLKDYARINNEDTGCRVKSSNFVHTAQVKHNLVENWHAPTDKTCIPTLRHDGKGMFI